MIECVDEILHFFLIKSVQLNFIGFSENEREQVFTTLCELYDHLADSFSDFITINKQSSRMVLKHRAFLSLVKEEPDVDEEEKTPFHLLLCLKGESETKPSLKTISVRNLYICERSRLKAELLGNKQLLRSTAQTYERVLGEIRAAYESIQASTDDVTGLIEKEEALKLIDAKLHVVKAIILSSLEGEGTTAK